MMTRLRSEVSLHVRRENSALVATKERKPKGNVGKGDDDHAKVFMDVRYENNSVIVDKHGYVIGPWNTCDVGGHQSGRKTIRVDNK